MLKFLKLAALALVVPVVAFGSSTVMAAAEGQIEGGDIYYSRNITKGTGFGDPITADKCETVQLRVRVHNPGPGTLSGVTVKATLPSGKSASHVSTATVSANNSDPRSVSDTATVNSPAPYTMNYLSGSTQLLDASGNLIKALPDGVITSGVNIGNVGVSIGEKRFVQFNAKLECPQPPKEECPEGTTGTPPNCETPTTPTTPETPPTPTAPASLPATGPEALASGVIGSGALGYGVRRWLMSRHALRNALKR